MIELHHKDCLELMKEMESGSLDIICIDPPYLYLKNQKLERPFDELLFFSECKRLLTKDGFIIMFGRGDSFYRWNTILSGFGFTFKEEIIWDKSHGTSPVSIINRVHETISIYTKGKGALNNIKIPYSQARTIHDLDKVVNDVNRLMSVFNNEKSFNHVLNFIEGNRSDIVEAKNVSQYNTSLKTRKHGSQTVAPMIAIKDGMKVKSIIRQIRDHYTSIHPTQKPVRLLERLLSLVIPKDKENVLVADFFGGSFSTMEACRNLGLNGISCEIDEEYFNLGKKRIDSLPPIQQEFNF